MKFSSSLVCWQGIHIVEIHALELPIESILTQTCTIKLLEPFNQENKVLRIKRNNTNFILNFIEQDEEF